MAAVVAASSLSGAGIGAGTAAATPAGPVGQVVRRDSGDGLIPTFRYNGWHRYDTARLIAGEAIRSDTVLIARGDLYPDALAGSYLAGARQAPILLAVSDHLPRETLDALAERSPAKVVLVGGPRAIGAEVEARLSALGYQVSRLGGYDRYETAAAVARAGGEVGLLDGLPTAILASGQDFPDALVSGAIAYDRRFPILLTSSDDLHEASADALSELGVRQVLIPGGEAAVGPAVRQRLEADGYTLIGVAGATRVETALALADFTVTRLGWDPDYPVFARGDDFADALTVGPRQGTRRDVLLLTADPTTLEGEDPQVSEFLENNGCTYTEIGFAGGAVAISVEVEAEIRQAAHARGVCPPPVTPTPTPTPTPVVPSLTLDPDDTLAAAGMNVTFTATVTDPDGQPLADQDVRLEVYGQRGPEQIRRAVVTVSSDPDGRAPLVVSQEGLSFLDHVVACLEPGVDGTCLTTSGDRLELAAGQPANVQADQGTDWGRVTWETFFAT
jgi:putative cell wall-binding protein